MITNEDEKEIRVSEICDLIEKYNYFYYVLDQPLVDNLTYDSLMSELRELDFDRARSFYLDYYSKPKLKPKAKREYKGKSLLNIQNDYVVVDIETTGLDSSIDNIIEIGAIKVCNNEIADTFNSFIHIDDELSSFIINLTGITDEMLSDAPNLNEVLTHFSSFISESDVIVGHNVNFDINFLYDNFLETLGMPFTNDFIDTLRLSRKLFPNFANHKLCTLISEFHISKEVKHRALSDCMDTMKCYEHMKNYIVENNIYLSTSNHYPSIHAKDITTGNTEFDTSHPLYNKVCVFTGVLEKMTRKEAMQIVADCGGTNEDRVTKKTNYLILGNNDYCNSIKDGKSTKQKKAEEYLLKGYDILILSENAFYDMIEQEVPENAMCS